MACVENGFFYSLVRPQERFAAKHVDEEIETMGSRLASSLLHRTVTWKASQSLFKRAIGEDGYFGVSSAVETEVMSNAPKIIRTKPVRR